MGYLDLIKKVLFFMNLSVDKSGLIAFERYLIYFYFILSFHIKVTFGKIL